MAMAGGAKSGVGGQQLQVVSALALIGTPWQQEGQGLRRQKQLDSGKHSCDNFKELVRTAGCANVKAGTFSSCDNSAWGGGGRAGYARRYGGVRATVTIQTVLSLPWTPESSKGFGRDSSGPSSV